MNLDFDKVLSLITNKKEVLAKMLALVERNHKQMEGCNKMKESISREKDPNHSQANLIRCLEISLQISAKNSEDLMELGQLLLVYMQGNNFTSDVAALCTKLNKNRSREALKAMMDAKLRGE